jgi:hypothetical protein
MGNTLNSRFRNGEVKLENLRDTADSIELEEIYYMDEVISTI